MDGTKVPMKQAVAMQRENDLIKTIKQLTCSEKYDLTQITYYFWSVFFYDHQHKQNMFFYDHQKLI